MIMKEHVTVHRCGFCKIQIMFKWQAAGWICKLLEYKVSLWSNICAVLVRVDRNWMMCCQNGKNNHKPREGEVTMRLEVVEYTNTAVRSFKCHILQLKYMKKGNHHTESPGNELAGGEVAEWKSDVLLARAWRPPGTLQLWAGTTRCRLLHPKCQQTWFKSLETPSCSGEELRAAGFTGRISFFWASVSSFRVHSQ